MDREDEALALAHLTQDLLDATSQILKESSSPAREIMTNNKTMSVEKMKEVASYVLRDLDRIEDDQDGNFSISKFVGYIAFWYSKLKPLNTVWYRDHSTEGTGLVELIDANERVSLAVASVIFWQMVRINPELQPVIWKECEVSSCTVGSNGAKGKCFARKNQKFLTAHQGKYKKYIEYGLRHRSISPYFLVHYFDSGIAYSCEHFCPPLYSQS